MRRSRESTEEYDSRKRPRAEEKAHILEQPMELLYKQLSDPSITLQDIENFCATNRALRELCQANPFFQLKEGKRVFVRIEKDRVNDSLDDYIINIFNYQGINVIVNHFTLSFIKGEASLKDVLNTLNAESSIVIGRILIEFDDMSAFYQTDREGRREGITRPTPEKYVKISHAASWLYYTARESSFSSLPYSLFQSIIYEAVRLDEENLYGIINILVNGDVIYDKLETITPDPTLASIETSREEYSIVPPYELTNSAYL